MPEMIFACEIPRVKIRDQVYHSRIFSLTNQYHVGIVLVNVMEQVRTEEQLSLANRALESSTEGIVLLRRNDPSSQELSVVFANEAASIMCQLAPTARYLIHARVSCAIPHR